jgi:GT2 family glycosyltransferase
LTGTAAVATADSIDANRADRPTLSVVIVSYNCRELLAACLTSLEQERARVRSEVLLVDNASTDGTLAFVTERFTWVNVEQAEGNIGFARANNVGMARARGDYILLLNPDTVVPPGVLLRTLAQIESRPDVGMLGCRLVRPDGSLDHACKRSFPTPLGALAYFARLDRRWVPKGLRTFAAQYTANAIGEHETAHVDAVNGAFMLVRREAMEDVGPLDETFWMYGEDLDWCARFRDSGWRVLYWPEVSVIHAKGGSSGNSRSFKTNWAFHRAMWLFYKKHQRQGRGQLVTAGVWSAVYGKFCISALRNAARLSISHRRSSKLTRLRTARGA